jgi:hypothetical protein
MFDIHLGALQNAKFISFSIFGPQLAVWIRDRTIIIADQDPKQ